MTIAAFDSNLNPPLNRSPPTARLESQKERNGQKPGKIERSEAVERLEKTEKSDAVARSKKVERSEAVARLEKIGSLKAVARLEKIE